MFFNRDISWVQFNSRVLQLALDRKTPLLERVKFLQIFTTNLDEFFMKRVGGLKRQVELGVRSEYRHQIEPVELLRQIRREVIPLIHKQYSCWKDDIVPDLAKNGVFFLAWKDLSSREKEDLSLFFEKNVFPVLTPLAVGPGHPFPFLSNLSYSLGILLQEPSNSSQGQCEEPLFARVKLPSTFPQWVKVNPFEEGNSQDVRFISLKEIVTQFMGKLFPGMQILDSVSFRITRNADIERDEEGAEDLLEMIAEELRKRKFAKIVRFETGPSANPVLKKFLKNELELNDDEIYENLADIDFSKMGPIFQLKREKLKYFSWTPVIPRSFHDPEQSIFNVIREKDVLVHHPYESFTHSVERFVQEAADDPKVLAIKMTLYRTGADSPFIPLLIRAAEAGKQVVCLVELKARFDEERNIQVARALEDAGVHVVYGIVGLKTHCKVTLVVRQEETQVRSYVHIGTGNYHSVTSHLYTDFGLFTSKREITDDVIQLFHYLTGRSLNRNYKNLLVAPVQMKERFLELIRNETQFAQSGKPARIIAKMNSLEDEDIIRALYEASQAGVEIDLIVRGFCCLVPQMNGLSENIRVTSIVGRFLEHCRIFYFGGGSENPIEGKFFIGSADWMSRNLMARVEAVVPMIDPALKRKLFDFIQVLLSDQKLAWELQSDGTYCQRQPRSEMACEGTHEFQIKLYESLNRNWSLSMPALSH